LFSCFDHNKKTLSRLSNNSFPGGPNVIREEHFFRNLIELDARLGELGIVKVDGVMTYVNEEDRNV